MLQMVKLDLGKCWFNVIKVNAEYLINHKYHIVLIGYVSYFIICAYGLVSSPSQCTKAYIHRYSENKTVA